jgi:predicted transcriptional regulator
MNNNEQTYAEIPFSPDQMQNIPESASPWFVQHSDGKIERDSVVDEIMPLIKAISRCLTARQKDIMRLHFQEQHTQAEIAKMLGISQATVNHHLIGKMKHGKSVGGAIQKIQKAIRKETMAGGRNVRRNQLIAAFNDMLDTSSTRRNVAGHFKKLFRLSKRHP